MSRRRRSARVAISVISFSAALGACDDPAEPAVYRSVAECSAEHGAADCDSAWQASVGEHQASAPQYAARDQCEVQYGAGHCQHYAGPQGSVFIPMMAGFMIGRALRRPDDNNSAPGGAYIGHPVFYTPSGGYSAPAVRPGESVFTRRAGFTERAGFGRAGGFSFGGRGG